MKLVMFAEIASVSSEKESLVTNDSEAINIGGVQPQRNVLVMRFLVSPAHRSAQNY